MSSKVGVVLNCRSCTRACRQYKSLRDELELSPQKSITLANMLKFLTGLSFEPQDGATMPQHICVSCLDSLEQAFRFKRTVIESDELLRQGLDEVNEEYVVIEMLDEEQNANVTTSDDVTEFVDSVDTQDSEYVIETVAEPEVETETIEFDNVTEYQPLEYVTIKSEYSSLVEEDEIGVLDCPTDGIIGEQMLEEVVVFQADDIGVEGIGEMEDSMSIEHEEQLVTGESDEEYPCDELLDESVGSPKLLSDVLPHVCSVCGKAFRQQCRLNQHMRSHIDEKLYSCEVCDRKLKHFRNYKDHMLTHTNVKPHQCNICSRFYRTTSSLAVHKRTHAEDKPYKCDECGRGYAAFDHLRRHKLTHSGERPYACDLCDKAYYDSSSLRQHKISHTGEKAFTCEICGVGLSQKSGYKKHMLVHSGEKPHKCPICDRAFTFTSNLNAHVRLHSGEKPFKCDKCLKAFPTKKRLNSHLRVHNKEAPVMPTARQGDRLITGARTVRHKDGNRLPDVPDQQVSTSKVVVVL